MTIDALGEVSIGDMLPTIFVAIGSSITEAEARLAAAVAFSAQLAVQPPAISFTAKLAVAANIIANINASVAAGVTLPSLQAQIDASILLIAEIEIQLALLLAINVEFPTASIFAYVYSGAVEDFGSEFTTEFASGLPGGGPTDPSDALIMITTVPASFASMEIIFKTT